MNHLKPIKSVKLNSEIRLQTIKREEFWLCGGMNVRVRSTCVMCQAYKACQAGFYLTLSPGRLAGHPVSWHSAGPLKYCHYLNQQANHPSISLHPIPWLGKIKQVQKQNRAFKRFQITIGSNVPGNRRSIETIALVNVMGFIEWEGCHLMGGA